MERIFCCRSRGKKYTGDSAEADNNMDAEARPETTDQPARHALPQNATDDSHSIERSRLFVQYVEDNPRALAYFGASLWTSQEHGHVLKEVDGTGLAESAKLKENDVIIGLSGCIVEESAHLALVDGIRHRGTKIAFIIRRCRQGQQEYGWTAFELGNEDGRPVVTKHYQTWEGTNFSELSPTPVFPPWVAFPRCISYSYYDSQNVNLWVESIDEINHYLGIARNRAAFTTIQRTLQMCKYNTTSSSNDSSALIVAFANLPQNSNNQLCISGNTASLLDVLSFPSYMTDPRRPIPVNPMFFFLYRNRDNTYYVRSADSNPALYMNYEQSNNNQASLTAGRNATLYLSNA